MLQNHKWFTHLARTTRGVHSKGDYAKPVSTILQRVSVALQKGNARMILHWQAFSPLQAASLAAHWQGAGQGAPQPPAAV